MTRATTVQHRNCHGAGTGTAQEPARPRKPQEKTMRYGVFRKNKGVQKIIVNRADQPE